MLSVQDNEKLTRVGKGTPMGELLRRYWHPIAATAELDDRPTKEVRIFGEDLVLYKDKSGRYGLIDRYCPHRRVDLTYGIPEEQGLRCMYHGWMFDESGRCVEQPFEETVHPDGRFKEKVRVTAYPVQEKSGLLFAYLGPEPVPFLPHWEPLTWTNCVFEIAISHIPCNWLQCMENSLDPVHVEWLHRFYTFRQQALDPTQLDALPPRIPHKEIGFDVFEHGIIKRRVLEGYTKEHDDWKFGHPVLFPNILFVGGDGILKMLQYRVPIDDENTLHITFSAFRAGPGAELPRQTRVPYKYVPLYDENGNFNVTYTIDQDKMAWATQGRIAQRHRERLGESDKGIILYRKLLMQQIDVALDGGDPMNVFRDKEKAEHIHIPTERAALGWDKRKAVKYVPLEAGVSDAVPDILRVFESWTPEKFREWAAAASR